MRNISSVRMAHEYGASKESFEKVTQIMQTEVSIPCSARYNSLYDDRDLHHALMALSMGNSYAESGMKGLALEAAGARVPSGSWVRDAAAKVPEQGMRAMLERALESTAAKVAAFRLLTMPVMAAIDAHKVPRYDARMEPFLRRGKHEKGTSTFEVYANLQCVEEGRRCQLSCDRQGFFKDNEDVVERLLVDARLQSVDIYLLLLDRGFFGSPVVDRLKKLRQPFLMPAIKNSGIKRAIMEYVAGKRKCVSEYTMHTPDGGAASFNLVILPKEGSEKEADPVDRHLVFATNIPEGRILWNIRRLPEDYRKRWGIETGYVGIERLRARTTSRNHSLRLLYFYYSLILYNAWLLANLTLANRFEVLLPLAEPIIPIQTLKVAFRLLIVESMGCG